MEGGVETGEWVAQAVLASTQHVAVSSWSRAALAG